MRPIPFVIFAAFAAGSLVAQENLLVNGSFEEPQVAGRTPAAKAANPAGIPGETSWEKVLSEETAEQGRAVIGVTDEIARTGKQSLYLNYEEVTATEREALIGTKPVAVEAGSSYRASIWGRIDRDRPLALDERAVQMWVEVHFFADDRATEVAEPINGPTLIPGVAVPGGPRHLVFVSAKWKETHAEFVVPEKCAFVRVYWAWTTGRAAGKTDGVIFWDDAALVKIEPPKELLPNPSPGAAEPVSPLVPATQDFKQQ